MHITFNQTARRQTIDNFGASQAWWVDVVGETFPAEAMTQIADLLFDRERGIGLSCTRFNIGGGSTWYDTEYVENWFMRSECFQRGPNAPYDWTRHEGQRRLLAMARERGVERTIAFVNSPPAWMTVNGHTRGDERTGTTNLRHGMEREFGEFLAGVLKHFADEGMPFDYLSPINEPQVPWDSPKQEGCRYSNEAMTRTVLAVRAALDAAGVSTPILFNETNNIFALIDLDLLRPYFESQADAERYLRQAFQFGGKYAEGIKDVFGNPAVRDAIAPIVAYHSYETDSPQYVTMTRRLTAQTMARYPGYTPWMTEYCVLGPYGPRRDLGIDAGLYIANVIHHDLVDLDAAAWQWWCAVSGVDYKDGLVYLDLDEKRVRQSKMLWALGHWSRFLGPGSVRVELGSDAGATESGAIDSDDGLQASGYLSADGAPVIVAINASHEEQRLTVNEASVSGWRRHVTSSEHDLSDLGSTRDSLVVPARSLATFVGE